MQEDPAYDRQEIRLEIRIEIISEQHSHRRCQGEKCYNQQ